MHNDYVMENVATDLLNDEVVSLKRDLRSFDKWMQRCNLSDATIKSYTRTMEYYFKKYNALSKHNLLAYKDYLINREYAPKTINSRINALNKYCDFCNRKSLKLSLVKVQNKPFLDNIISEEDYKYFVRKLKEDEDYGTYFLVKFMACTGARVSELIKFKVEHVYTGYMDIYAKGGKFRRVYIPTRLRNEAIKWFEATGREEGLIFKNKNGETIGTTGVSYKIKQAAKRYKRLDLKSIYPHSFRHYFAIHFLRKHYDLLLLADVLGHNSLETTKIYTRMSSAEQASIINEVVDW